MNPNLIKRGVSGLIFATIMILGTISTEWSFYLLWCAVGVLSIYEYLKLVKDNSKKVTSLSTYYMVGVAYIALPIMLILTLDQIFVFTLITIVWANDTGAYLVGSSIGKHKMAPKISPKKSWEGFFGGVIFAIAVSLIWYSLYWSKVDGSQLQEMIFGVEAVDNIVPRILWMLFGLCVAVAAVVGDLFESKLKRNLGVKDSGNMIPGHGGMLDRFDATFMAVYVAVIFSYILVLA